MRFAVVALLAVVVPAGLHPRLAAAVKVEVSLAAGMPAPGAGRLLVAFAAPGQTPRFTDTDPPGQPVAGVDADKFPAVLDGTAMMFPAGTLANLPAGEYAVQAVFARNRDINLPSAPGNFFSPVVRVKIDPAAGTVVKLALDQQFQERKPADTATTKYVKLPSKLLSAFHGRPMEYRFAVILPPGFDAAADKKYPLVVHIGGFGTRYTSARGIRADARFVQILLDGAGPNGDPYQVNSANNGPYGDALTQEVIPYVEATYRGLGTPQSRFTTGGSTGGWVSLALQVFYPDTFNGCWSQCPDGVDFAAFELIDIYRDANAYVNRFGFERPSKRTLDGDTVFTVRYESRLERVLGRGGKWENACLDWASWNATYGPRGADGNPKPLWDGETGAIDATVLDHWKKYDLRRVLDANWAALGPKLGGKIHVWVGDADDYFLNNAVHRLKASLDRQTGPKFDGSVQIEMRKPHTSGGWSRAEMLDAMAARVR